MLQLPALNDQDIASVLATATLQIERYSGQCWTERGVHDPGITFLELLSWLKIEQQKEIDIVGIKSLRKFMALLGLAPHHAEPAVAQVAFQTARDVILPQGVRLESFGMVYETEERVHVLANRITALGAQEADGLRFQPYDQADGARAIPAFGAAGSERDACYIAFERALPQGIPIFLHIELNRNAEKRNPVTDRKTFMPLADVVWEYYGGELGCASWREAELLGDDTLGLLFSGQVKLLLGAVHAPLRGDDAAHFCLRARLRENGYDVMPVLSGIQINSVRIRQQLTRCRSFFFTRQEAESGAMVFDDFLATDGCFELFLRQDGGYVRAADCGVSFAIEQREQGLFCLVLPGWEGNYGAADKAVCLLVYDGDFFAHRILGSGDGQAEKVCDIWLDQPQDMVVHETFTLFIEQKEPSGRRWNAWEKAVTLDAARPKDRCYLFSPAKAQVTFGDNLHGKVPSRGEGNLLIAGLQTTRGAGGNLNAGAIQGLVRAELFPTVRVVQFTPAAGGRNEESAGELLDRAIGAVSAARRVAVTATDYEHFARQTPGLIVDVVSVIPLYRPHLEHYPACVEPNAVTIVAAAHAMRRGSANPVRYLENVRQQMERVRLITTKIYVMSPEYLPLDLFAEITFRYGAVQSEQRIRTAVEAHLLCLDDCTLYAGDLQQLLASLEDVEAVRNLSVETDRFRTRIGEFGDIRIPPYARLVLRALFLQ